VQFDASARRRRGFTRCLVLALAVAGLDAARRRSQLFAGTRRRCASNGYPPSLAAYVGRHWPTGSCKARPLPVRFGRLVVNY